MIFSSYDVYRDKKLEDIVYDEFDYICFTGHICSMIAVISNFLFIITMNLNFFVFYNFDNQFRLSVKSEKKSCLVNLKFSFYLSN